MFDISSTAVAPTAAMHVKNAKGEFLYDADKNPVRIHVHGPGTAAFAEVEARQTQRHFRRKEENDGKVAVAAPDVRRIEEAEDLAAITASFENLGYGGGKLTGTDLFKAVYADPALGFVALQVRKFVGDWGNFSGGSATA
ncbi:hypothetical protein [uncultured Sphingomonas sp.]|uniref:hypothetical protein n=1 Tax=uncultured Sphingomonas sp. TaxID=158754 RepID=UPI0025D3916D|nr:hypothetical protein [uncultured Sphingomonas sp.]